MFHEVLKVHGQRRQGRHDDQAAPGLVGAQQRTVTPEDAPVNGHSQAAQSADFQDRDVNRASPGYREDEPSGTKQDCGRRQGLTAHCQTDPSIVAIRRLPPRM
jgi:hypothetical protein